MIIIAWWSFNDGDAIIDKIPYRLASLTYKTICIWCQVNHVCTFPPWCPENYLTYGCNPLTEDFYVPTQEVGLQYLQIIWRTSSESLGFFPEELLGLEKCVESILALELQVSPQEGEAKGQRRSSFIKGGCMSLDFTFCRFASVELCLWCPFNILCAPWT